MIAPGAVVTVEFIGARETKNRPVVIVSTDSYHSNRPDIIVSLLTGQVADATQPTDYVLQDWASAGLRLPSAFRAYLQTCRASRVIREVGRLSDRDWQEVQARLRIALAVT